MCPLRRSGANALDQTCITGDDDTEELARVEILAGQDTHLAQDGGERFLSLVEMLLARDFPIMGTESMVAQRRAGPLVATHSRTRTSAIRSPRIKVAPA